MIAKKDAQEALKWGDSVKIGLVKEYMIQLGKPGEGGGYVCEIQ